MARKKKVRDLDKDLRGLFREQFHELNRALGLSTLEDEYDYAGIKLINGDKVLLEVDYYEGYPGSWEIEKSIYGILVSNKLFISKFTTERIEDEDKILVIHTTDDPYRLMFIPEYTGEDAEWYEKELQEALDEIKEEQVI